MEWRFLEVKLYLVGHGTIDDESYRSFN